MWVKVVPDLEAKTFLPLIDRRVERYPVICPDTWTGYTGVARNYVHRLVEHGWGEYGDSRVDHIYGLEEFLGYLKRSLASKGGIRKERLLLCK